MLSVSLLIIPWKWVVAKHRYIRYNDGMTININVETKNIIKVFTLAVIFTLGVFAVMKMSDALMLVLISFFAALALNPAVSFLSKYMPGKRRGPAIFIVFVAVIALLSFLLGSIIPPVVRESSNFIRTLPEAIDNSFYRSERVQDMIVRYDLQDNIDGLAELARQRVTSMGSDVVGSVGRVGGSILNTITGLVITVLMLTGGGKLLKSIADTLYRDPKLRARHENVASKMYGAVTGYVIGQVSMASLASVTALGMMLLLGIPYPLPLAAIVFILGLIPLVGNTLAAILVILMTLVLKDVTSGLILLAFFVAYQQIENVTLQPVVQGKTSNLPPLVIFVSVILGVGLMGPIGGLFAIPAAGCLKVLFLDWAAHRDDPKPSDTPVKLATKIKHKLTGTKPTKA